MSKIINKYKILKKNSYINNNLKLVPIKAEYIERIRIWRNSQLSILRQEKKISSSQQNNYFINNIWSEIKSNTPKNILFAIEYNKKIIGYGGLVHISWINKRAEISFLLNQKFKENSIHFEKLFKSFIHIIKNLSFTELGLLKISTEAFEHREKLINLISELGFKEKIYYKNQYLKFNKFQTTIIQSCYLKNFKKENSRFNANNKHILITASSAKFSLINEVNLAIEKSNLNYKILLSDKNPNVPSKYYYYKFVKFPKFKDENIKKILDKLIKLKVHIVIPTSDQELIFWSKWSNYFKKFKIKLFISNYKIVDICLDKLKLYNFCKKNYIRTIEILDQKKLKIKNKYIIKERYGLASRNILKNLTHDKILNNLKNFKQPIIQKHINQKEISVDAYYNQKKKLIGFIVRKRKIIINGESKVSIIETNQNLGLRVKKILMKFALLGHVNFQFFIDKKLNIQLIEINPRFGGASSLSIRAGLDSFYWFITEVNNKKVNIKDFKINEYINLLVKNTNDTYI